MEFLNHLVKVFKDYFGVFDEEKNEIVHAKLIEADELDAKTREVLGNEDLIVLS